MRGAEVAISVSLRGSPGPRPHLPRPTPSRLLVAQLLAMTRPIAATAVSDVSRPPASSESVLLPRAPALVAGFREILWLSADGEIEAVSPEEVRARLAPDSGETPIVCHARAVARRLDLAGFAALDVLELFAFVAAGAVLRSDAARSRRRARPAAASHDGRCLRHADRRRPRAAAGIAGRRRHRKPRPRRNRRACRLGLGSGRARCVAAGRPTAGARSSPRAEGRTGCASGRTCRNGRSAPPPPPPGNDPVSPRRSAATARACCSATAPRRGRNRPITPPPSPPPSRPREHPDTPQAVLAEAGTGVGKTLGYIAPASLWAEKNQGAVWISTYTRNLQSQIDGELDRLYPDPAQKRRRVVIRKGRENFLCLLNYEDAARAASARGGAGVGGAGADRALDRGDRVRRSRRRRFSGLARRADRSRPGQLRWPTGAASASIRPARISAAASSRRTCAPRGMRASSSPTMRWSWRRRRSAGSTTPTLPTRYVFDEGHHLLDAADAAFSVRLSGQEGRELRRWLLGAEAGRSRARGLQRRIGDLVEADEEAGAALVEALVAARILPADGWHQRVAEDRRLPGFEAFLALVRRQVLARAANGDAAYRHRGRGAAADRRA